MFSRNTQKVAYDILKDCVEDAVKAGIPQVDLEYAAQRLIWDLRTKRRKRGRG